MSQKHTEAPWEVSKDGLAAIEPGTDIEIITGYISDCTDDEVRSAIKHIVACVNALAGLNPEWVPGLVEAAQRCYTEMEEAGYHTANENFEALGTALAEAKKVEKE